MEINPNTPSSTSKLNQTVSDSSKNTNKKAPKATEETSGLKVNLSEEGKTQVLIDQALEALRKIPEDDPKRIEEARHLVNDEITDQELRELAEKLLTPIEEHE